MKKILSFLAASLLLMTMFVNTGCEDDPVVDPVKDAPTLDLSSTDVSDGGEIEFELSNVSTVTFTLTGLVGTDQLSVIRLRENGSAIDLAKIDVTGGSTTIGSADAAILGTDKDGFSWTVVYTPDAVVGTYDFSATLSDEGGLTSNEVSFRVNVVDDPGTPLTNTLTGVLFNQAGPSGKGTLDLDEGKSAGVTSNGDTTPDQAEIRDMGLDCTIPAPGLNWRRQIGAFNGTELRKVDATQVENFTFDNVSIVEDIKNAYDTGVTFGAGTATNCSTSATVAVQHVSSVLAVGDLYVVLKGSTYYLIQVDEVVETAANNDDYYTFSIKFGTL